MIRDVRNMLFVVMVILAIVAFIGHLRIKNGVRVIGSMA